MSSCLSASPFAVVNNAWNGLGIALLTARMLLSITYRHRERQVKELHNTLTHCLFTVLILSLFSSYDFFYCNLFGMCESANGWGHRQFIKRPPDDRAALTSTQSERVCPHDKGHRQPQALLTFGSQT